MEITIKKFNKLEKDVVVINFTRHPLSNIAKEQLHHPVEIQLPLEIDRDTDIAYYIDEILDKAIDFESAYNSEKKEWNITYLVVLPGLPILSGMVCRNLSESGIPYLLLNLIRNPETGEFIVQDIY